MSPGPSPHVASALANAVWRHPTFWLSSPCLYWIYKILITNSERCSRASVGQSYQWGGSVISREWTQVAPLRAKGCCSPLHLPKHGPAFRVDDTLKFQLLLRNGLLRICSLWLEDSFLWAVFKLSCSLWYILFFFLLFLPPVLPLSFLLTSFIIRYPITMC